MKCITFAFHGTSFQVIECGRGYAVCLNLCEDDRQRAHREAVLRELEAELSSLSRVADEEQHRKRVCQLRVSGPFGRYLRLTRGGEPRVDRAGVGAAERLDGKFVVHSNDDTLTAGDMALGY